MPTYILPQVQVFQDFQTSPSAAANPLRAHISGPHAQLIRYDEADEQADGLLGVYDPLNDTDYLWPNRTAGGVIDQTYVKLFAKNAILRYYLAAAGGADAVTKLAGKTNQVRSSGTAWKTNGEFERDALLLDRDVTVGDIVKLRFIPAVGDPVTMWSYVAGFDGEPVAAVTATATNDDDNADTSVASATYSQTQGPFNAVEITAASAAAYDPYPTGQVTETYTIIVTGSSVNGDFSTATLRILSASGLDDVAEVTPADQSLPTTLGTHGATVTFNATGGGDASESATDAGISPNDLLVGQRFQVVVHATFTATPVPTSAGTYTGDTDTTYIVEVVEGNKFATGAPKIKVTTTTGVDLSGPTAVSAAATAVAVGTESVTISFAGIGLLLGDRFYIDATAAAIGSMQTLILGNTIPSTVADGDDADISLFIKHPTLQITQDREDAAPLTDFDMSTTEITVNSSITAFDATWTDGGELVALPLDADETKGYSTLYVEYRAWLTTLCTEIGIINDVALLNDQISGALDPDNPLKWAVFKALENSNGVDVMYTAVCSPDDVESWADVLELTLGRDDIYGLVPLTRNNTVWDLFQAHVDAESAPEQGLWRVAWFNLSGLPSIPVVSIGSDVPGYTAATTGDAETALATILDDPDTSGTQYTIVTNTASNANFLTNGVRAGDILRTNYSSDGFGNFTYEEYVIDAVDTEETIRLLTGPAAAINTASKIEVWRTLSATTEADAIGKVAGAFANRRVRCVWPDTIDSSGTTQEGYHLCAALAGLRSGIVPQQGMTNLSISGFTAAPRSRTKFNRPQLDSMAVQGVWIVTQSNTGEIYTRHAVTTGDYMDLNEREEMLTSNVDSISYRFKDLFAPFIGIANVTPSIIQLLRLEVIGLVEVLKSEKSTALLGGQLIDATIVDIRQHLILKDRIVLILNIDPPRPFNNFDVHLVIPVATATVVPALTGAQPVPTTPTTTG